MREATSGTFVSSWSRISLRAFGLQGRKVFLNLVFSEPKRADAVIGWFINFTSFPTWNAPESGAIS